MCQIHSKFYIQCKQEEFTCNDGQCLNLTKRCNDLFECKDGSDEQNCEPLTINKDSYRKIMPNYEEGKKTVISVKAVLKAITKVNQLAMTFQGDIKIILSWKDGRISFKDLGPNGSYLNPNWKNQIWLPPLYFPNTVGKFPVTSDKGFTVKVLKQGGCKLNNELELHEGFIYNGNENVLELTSHYEYTFHCRFELSNFPFDTQLCNMTLKVPSEMKNFIQLYNSSLEFEGESLKLFTYAQGGY